MQAKCRNQPVIAAGRQRSPITRRIAVRSNTLQIIQSMVDSEIPMRPPICKNQLSRGTNELSNEINASEIRLGESGPRLLLKTSIHPVRADKQYSASSVPRPTRSIASHSSVCFGNRKGNRRLQSIVTGSIGVTHVIAIEVVAANISVRWFRTV